MKGLDIFISQGDTGDLPVSLPFCGCGDETEEDGLVVMGLKKSPYCEEVIWQKELHKDEDGKWVATFAAEDTTQVPFGNYWWDARRFSEDGSVFTPMLPHRFVIGCTITPNL